MESLFCRNLKRIKINADVGEGTGNDGLIMPFLDLCNIACGGHYGNNESIQETVNLALKNKVKIGAHPSYPDRENFGRISMKMDWEVLKKSLIDQILNFKKIVERNQGKLNHIKFHGALYNDMVTNPDLFKNCQEIIKSIDKSLKLITPDVYAKNDKLLNENNYVYEVFGDRNYNQDKTLISRKSKNALITDAHLIVENLKFLLAKNRIKSLRGELIQMKFDTICIHGDTENSVEILKTLRRNMLEWEIDCKDEF